MKPVSAGPVLVLAAANSFLIGYGTKNCGQATKLTANNDNSIQSGYLLSLLLALKYIPYVIFYVHTTKVSMVVPWVIKCPENGDNTFFRNVRTKSNSTWHHNSHNGRHTPKSVCLLRFSPGQPCAKSERQSCPRLSV
jgi:hypothetical protein